MLIHFCFCRKKIAGKNPQTRFADVERAINFVGEAYNPQV